MSYSRSGQIELFKLPRMDKVVNVASVSQRSPFRYPGGKTWLVPHVEEWISRLSSKPSVFIEPFAGGAIVGLTAAFEKLAERVVLVELDDQVAAVWKAVLGRQGEWLARRILDFDLTSENVRSELSHHGRRSAIREKAFRTVLKNRTFHGGILAPGSSLIKYGENGKGLSSRWYPETLAKRIRDIVQIKDRIEIIEGDGIAIMAKYAKRRDVAFFIDPPYTAAGKRAGTRLYAHYSLDHERLFATAAALAGPFLMTYDNAPELVGLAEKHGLETRTIPMKNTHHARMYELVIGRDLQWLD
jgi:DNA adenine methylase